MYTVNNSGRWVIIGHKVYRKPTHTDRYLHYNSFHHPSIKNSVCKTLINRAKTICEVDNIEGELEHLRSVLKMNGYPKKFIDNARKTRQHVREKTEYQSSVSLPYIGSASHKIERILKEAGIQLYHSSENKLFRSLCTHKDSVNEFQKPGVYRIPCECGWYILVKLSEISHYVLKNIRLTARKPS